MTEYTPIKSFDLYEPKPGERLFVGKSYTFAYYVPEGENFDDCEVDLCCAKGETETITLMSGMKITGTFEHTVKFDDIDLLDGKLKYFLLPGRKRKNKKEAK